VVRGTSGRQSYLKRGKRARKRNNLDLKPSVGRRRRDPERVVGFLREGRAGSGLDAGIGGEGKSGFLGVAGSPWVTKTRGAGRKKKRKKKSHTVGSRGRNNASRKFKKQTTSLGKKKGKLFSKISPGMVRG